MVPSEKKPERCGKSNAIPQFTGQLAAVEVYYINNLKITNKAHFTGQEGADILLPVK